MFNIGGDGQLVIGAVGATLTAFILQNQAPSLVILLAALIVGTLFGAAFGFIPGFLKARTGAHEVITTIMLNYVAAQIVFFALRGPILRQPGSTAPVSKNMSTFVDVPLLINLPAIRLDFGFIAALLTAVVVSFLLFRTTKGFELRASGFNLTAARYAGMSAGGSMMLAMAISGGLMGLGGSFLVVGTVGQLSNDLSSGIGFNAIALALLAGLRPSGVVLAALLFGALSNGGRVMGIQTGVPPELLFFIIALVIMFVAAPGLIRTIWRIKVTQPPPELAISQKPVASE
jgi:simple sugar transport system permease protein